MIQKEYIEVTVAVDYDSSHTEETEYGIEVGREITEVVRVPMKDVVDMVQSQVCELDYYAAREFAKKYYDE